MKPPPSVIIFTLTTLASSALPLYQDHQCAKAQVVQCPTAKNLPEVEQLIKKEAAGLSRGNYESVSSAAVHGIPGAINSNASGGREEFCRPGNSLNASLVCDSQYLRRIPSDEIPNTHLDFLMVNATSLKIIREGDFAETDIFSMVIQENYYLAALDDDAFSGLGNSISYLKLARNRLETRGGLWGGEFFAPFRSLDLLRYLLIENNGLSVIGLGNDTDSDFMQPMLLPCLEYLSLRGNELQRLEANFFRALSCSPLYELNLASAGLTSIHNDAFNPLSHLRRLSLFNNFKLFQFVHSSLPPTLTLVTFDGLFLGSLNLAANSMTAVPFSLLAQTNSSLTKLNLSNNVFVELGMRSIKGYSGKDTFPLMKALESLYLRECRIQTLHEDVFANLPELKLLILDGNLLYTVPAAVATLTSLQKLSFSGFPEMFLDEQRFYLYDEGLTQLGNLTSLTIKDCSLGNLHHEKFSGLDNLEELVLDGSDLSLIENKVFSSLRQLKRLSLKSTTGLDYFPLMLLSGLDTLEVLDMTNVKLFPNHVSVKVYFEYLMSVRAAPLPSVVSLNLTGSLDNIDRPLDYLKLDSMISLKTLNISGNQIVSWGPEKTKFDANVNLSTLILTENHDYVNITNGMVTDFSRLDVLDMSNNRFVCNDGVAYFLKMVETGEGPDTVVGWSSGYGYFCKDRDGVTRTFSDYVKGGNNLETGYHPPEESGGDGNDKVNYALVLGPLFAFLCVVPFVAVMANVVYNNRWYIEYKWAKYQLRRRKKKELNLCEENSRSSFAYDVFVSYNTSDRDFVHEFLVPRLEAKARDKGRDDNSIGNDSSSSTLVRLCIHERDFTAGKTIVENIVTCLESSRACLIVLSRDYARSEWCRFEALVALQMFRDDDRLIKTIVVIRRNEVPGSLLTKSLRAVVKLRTYLEWRDEDEESEARMFMKRLRLSLGCYDDDGEL